MNSAKLQVVFFTLLAVFSSRTLSNLTNISSRSKTILPMVHRQRRVASTVGVEEIPRQSEICKEFVESKVVLKGAKAASPADIFNNLSIGKDFATAGRKYAKSYVFQSPNYPRNYPTSIECIKLIVAPSQEHRIYLQFSQPFALEPNSLCAMDFLEVRDGAFGFSPLIGRFCSRLPPPENEEIRSTSRYLWLRFRSDKNLPHAGFRAIFHYQKIGNEQDDSEDLRPHILRRLNVIQLLEDEQWTMRSEFLTKQLEYINAEERQLPLEAVVDIRSPPGTHILMYVHHFQVPQVAAWSCDPDFLVEQKGIKYCNYQLGSVSMRTHSYMERPPNIFRVKQYTPTVPDPVSYMDGRHTYVEVYTDGKTISESSPPCHRVERFCIASVYTYLSGSSDSSSSSSGSPPVSDKGGTEGRALRQFLVPSSRLVIRLVVAKPSKPPYDSAFDSEYIGVMENGIDPYEVEKNLDIFSMLPNFTFTLTTLSPRVNGVCASNQRACDEAYCIQSGHWCDGVINCPLGQDEGDAACNPDKAGVVESVEETDTTDLSEKDKAALERAMTEKADLEKHAAIIGSISLTLIIVTVICMFFAIRRKRKEASNHEIEIKLPSELESPQAGGKTSNKRVVSPSSNASKLLSADVIIDLDEIENEPVFSSSGDALLGRESASTQKGIFANHNWSRKTSPAVARALGLNNTNPKSLSTKAGKSRTALFQHQQIHQQRQKSPRNTWQSDVNLVQYTQIPHDRGKLNRDDSTKTADESTNFRYIQPQLPPRINNPPIPPAAAVIPKNRQPEKGSRSYHRHNQNRHQQRPLRHHHHVKDTSCSQQPILLVRQKTNSTDVPDSSCQERHVFNCRMLTENQRTRSLATSRFRLYDSRDVISYGVGISSSANRSRSSTSRSISSSSSTTSFSTNSPSPSSPTYCSSNSTTTTSFCPQRQPLKDYRGYENLVPYSVRLKAFRSMPDVARATGPSVIASGSGLGGLDGDGGVYQLAVSCGHKDCRDYYRLQALRSNLQIERKRPEKLGLEKPTLFREREIELTSSSEEEDAEKRGEVGVQNEAGGSTGGGGRSCGEKGIPLLPTPIASDAYSVHGLSDAISVESSKNGGNGSETTQSAFNEDSDENAHQTSCTSTNSLTSPLPPSRVSSGNRPLARVASLSKRLDSPASSRSRVRVHPTAPNLLVYEYEA